MKYYVFHWNGVQVCYQLMAHLIFCAPKNSSNSMFCLQMPSPNCGGKPLDAFRWIWLSLASCHVSFFGCSAHPLRELIGKLFTPRLMAKMPLQASVSARWRLLGSELFESSPRRRLRSPNKKFFVALGFHLICLTPLIPDSLFLFTLLPTVSSLAFSRTTQRIRLNSHDYILSSFRVHFSRRVTRTHVFLQECFIQRPSVMSYRRNTGMIPS